jgi:hypothetical protein
VTKTRLSQSGPTNNAHTPEDFPFGANAPPPGAAEASEESPRSVPPQGEPDPFDPAVLALSQDFAGAAGVKKEWDVIKVEKPSKSRVFRTHPDKARWFKTFLLVLKDDNEVYMTRPDVRAALRDEGTCGEYTLIPCVSKNGTPFLWPIRMQDRDGKWNPWHQSAFTIAEKAQARWCRMQANRDAGCYVAEYDQRPAEAQTEAEWPELTPAQWNRLAFQGFTIDSLDHPVLKRLHMRD